MSWIQPADLGLLGIEMMPLIRVVVADADAQSRSRLCAIFAGRPDTELLAHCGTVSEMMSAIGTYRPDLLLLDVDMRDRDPIVELKRLPVDEMPMIILIGSSDKCAMRAFEVRARDFLIKPFDSARLHFAIDHVRTERLSVHDRKLTHQLLTLLAGAQREPAPERRIALKISGRVLLLEQDQVDWIEAHGNYVKVKTGTESHLLREGIGRIYRRLDPKLFVRIHRSIIVNVRRIRELQPCNSGEYMVVLKDGKELSCSRGYRASLRQIITEH